MLYSFIIRFTDIQKLKSSCEILAISNKMSKLVYILLQTWEFTMQKFFTRHICLKHFLFKLLIYFIQVVIHCLIIEFYKDIKLNTIKREKNRKILFFVRCDFKNCSKIKYLFK